MILSGNRKNVGLHALTSFSGAFTPRHHCQSFGNSKFPQRVDPGFDCRLQQDRRYPDTSEPRWVGFCVVLTVRCRLNLVKQ